MSSRSDPSIAKPKRKTRAEQRTAPFDDRLGWVRRLAQIALLVFVGVPVIGLLMPNYAGRIVWTIVVASLPLFIVIVGFHRWRQICPLAFFATLPWRLGFAGKRRVPQEYEGLYYFVCFGLFVFSLWMRLIATNGSGISIAVFFIGISLAAFLSGMIFTGKTWCNYFCPVSFVEKIYTEPHGLRETPNSQCTKCTACKKACPDINRENGYWKEILLASKKFVYFAFPGVVFGFYFYYFLQSGTWDYYFGGKWVDETLPLGRLFLPGTDELTQGFHFWPAFPRAWAAILTLVASAAVSYWLFVAVEAILKRLHQAATQDSSLARHLMFSITAFAAFTTFYSFAGAPTISRLPWGSTQIFQIVVVLTGSLFLVRRLFRNQTGFAEETLARNILKRWQWKDVEPPTDLREAFLIHQIRTQEHDKDSIRVLDLYKDAVRESVQNGMVSRAELLLLQSLRESLKISESQHEQVMLELSEEERGAFYEHFDRNSAEKQLQLESYATALADYFAQIFDAGDQASDNVIDRLRTQYRVSESEHAAALDQLMGGGESFAERLSEEVDAVEHMSLAQHALSRDSTPGRKLLCMILQRARQRAVDRMLKGLSLTQVDETTIQQWRQAMNDKAATLPEDTLARWGSKQAGAIGRRLLSAWQDMVTIRNTMPSIDMILARLTRISDHYARAAALYELFKMGDASDHLLDRLNTDEHDLVRETALGLSRRRSAAAADSSSDSNSDLHPMLEIEKMIALYSASLFEGLDLPDLAYVSMQTIVQDLAPGEVLCEKGQPGSEVYFVHSGRIEVIRIDGDRDQKIADIEQDLIGEMAVLDPAPRSATLKAGHQGARVLKLDGTTFRQAVTDNPAIAFPVIQSLVRKLRA